MGIEGKQYKYYKNINATYNLENNALKKPSSIENTSSNGTRWWLRSPTFYNSGYFCGVNASGYCSNYSAITSYGVAPGFAI